MALRCYKDGETTQHNIAIMERQDFIEDSPTPARGGDHFQENNSDFIEDSSTPARRDYNQQNKMDDELALIENAFEYLTKKTYPPGCPKNVIRRKAGQTDCEQKGEGENSVLMPSKSYIRASRNEENTVTHNGTIYVDRSDRRCHENGIVLLLYACWMDWTTIIMMSILYVLTKHILNMQVAECHVC